MEHEPLTRIRGAALWYMRDARLLRHASAVRL